MVVQRGLRQAASYHNDRLRQERIGYFFDVITNGFGAMQGYAEQVPVRDRWLIASYVRALQFSQNAQVADVPADRRAELDGRRGEPQGASASRQNVRGPGSREQGSGREQRMATTETYQPPEAIGGLQRLGMGAALVGVVLTIVGFVMAGQARFFQAYLVAYTFWMGLVLGSLALLMVQHLSGGAWGIVIRRPLEAAVRTMPIMALLFMPDRRRHGRPLSLVACRRGRQRPHHPREGRVPESDVLHHAPGDLLRASGSRWARC